MGGSQSSRKIGIDNEEAVGVIRVSENVAQRLKNLNNGGGNNNPSPSQNPQPLIPVTQSNVSFQQPGGGTFIGLQHPFITSTMIREEIEKELEKNDRYWERRIKSLQDNQNKIAHKMESEFNKAYNEVEKNFPTLAPKDKAVPCQDYKSMVVDCIKHNANEPLNCSKVVNEFTSCIGNSRSKRHSEIRSP